MATPPLVDYFFNHYETSVVKKAAEDKLAEASRNGDDKKGAGMEQENISRIIGDFAPLILAYWSGKYK